MCTFTQSSCTDHMNIHCSFRENVYYWISLHSGIYLSFITSTGGSLLNDIQLSRLVYCYTKLCCISTDQTFSCKPLAAQNEQNVFQTIPLGRGTEVPHGLENEAFRFDEIRLDETLMISFEKVQQQEVKGYIVEKIGYKYEEAEWRFI